MFGYFTFVPWVKSKTNTWVLISSKHFVLFIIIRIIYSALHLLLDQTFENKNQIMCRMLPAVDWLSIQKNDLFVINSWPCKNSQVLLLCKAIIRRSIRDICIIVISQLGWCHLSPSYIHWIWGISVVLQAKEMQN